MRKIVAKQKVSLVALCVDFGYSKTKVKQLVKYGAISVNERPVALADHQLSPGDLVVIRSELESSSDIQPGLGIQIVYEDDAVLVIEKPSGLLAIATEKESVRTAYYQLNEFLKMRRPFEKERIFIVHRIDRDTSGLMVFAKSEAAKRTLQSTWKEADKKYAAIVEGVPKKRMAQISSQLVETKGLRVYSDGRGHVGKLAVTDYRVVKEGEKYALLEITLQTGRKNQIRVHMADIGHPIAGDKKYGAKTDPLGQLALHASSLSFNHPVTGKLMQFTSKASGRFQAFEQKMQSV